MFDVNSMLSGQTLQECSRDEVGNYSFLFSGASLAVWCLWRVVSQGRVKVTSEDHGQKFGLPSPVDAPSDAFAALAKRTINQAALDNITGDLILLFQGEVQLQILSSSSGYEAWTLLANGTQLVATGGGEVRAFPRAGPNKSLERTRDR